MPKPAIKCENRNYTPKLFISFKYLIHKGQCLCVCLSVWVSGCLFSIQIQTAGQIGMKFGTEVVLEGGKGFFFFGGGGF